MDSQEISRHAIEDSKNYIKMISDPIRTRILVETLLRGEVTAKKLMSILDINRSAISYHLGLMVENNILNVKIDEVGRPVKRYSVKSRDLLNKFDETLNRASEEEKKELLLAKLNLYAGTMQMIGNLSVDAVKQINNVDPIQEIGESQNQIVKYLFNNKNEFFIPLIFKFLSQDQMSELMDEFIQLTIQKIKSIKQVKSAELLKNDKYPYILLFTAFPLFHVSETDINMD